MSATRKIVVEFVYRDDPDRPREFNVRQALTTVEATWSRHLATQVEAWITSDSFGEAADR